ncbi:MAG TPA: F0F1 ATP synthase subunit A [Pyrinomonadaceae bacterium]|nr:F0F1 ATP synthase subunit A [Pyrinomonadaceae bacterium]
MSQIMESNFASSRVGLRLVLALLVFGLLLSLNARNCFAVADLTPKVSAMSSAVSNSATTTTSPKTEKHELSPKAVEIGRVFGLPVTNSMLVTWAVALLLVAFARLATRNMNSVPGGAQNFLEWPIESLYDFLQGLLGKHLVDRTFWYFATVFIFILSANWFGLIPGVGTIGWGHQSAHGFTVSQPLLRGANADVNLTLAMALVFFACWIVWAVREQGPIGFAKELFAPKGESSGIMKIVLAVVFFAVGCLEVISILFRPVSLSFRLYGNIFAGENMLETMATLAPRWGWLLPVPFYFLELLVGIVQALVFMLLTAVFTLLICQHEAKETTAHA